MSEHTDKNSCGLRQPTQNTVWVTFPRAAKRISMDKARNPPLSAVAHRYWVAERIEVVFNPQMAGGHSVGAAYSNQTRQLFLSQPKYITVRMPQVYFGNLEPIFEMLNHLFVHRSVGTPTQSKIQSFKDRIPTVANTWSAEVPRFKLSVFASSTAISESRETLGLF